MSIAPPEPRIARLLRLRDRLDQEIAAERARTARIHALTKQIPPTLDQQPLLIVLAVAHHYDLHPGDLTGTARSSKVATARAVAAWIARNTGLTIHETAALLHHGTARVTDWTHRVNNDPHLHETATTLRTILEATVRAAA